MFIAPESMAHLLEPHDRVLYAVYDTNEDYAIIVENTELGCLFFLAGNLEAGYGFRHSLYCEVGVHYQPLLSRWLASRRVKDVTFNHPPWIGQRLVDEEEDAIEWE